MKSSFARMLMSLSVIVIGIVICAAGIYIGEIDDAPGAALIGFILMIGTVVLGVKIARIKT